MNAARDAMGLGWQFAARPWSNDGSKGVSHSEPRMSGVLSLWLLSLCTGRRSASKEKVTRHKGEKYGLIHNQKNRFFKAIKRTLT